MANNNQIQISGKPSFKIKTFAALLIVFTILGLEGYLRPQILLHAYLKPFGIIFLVSGTLVSIFKIILAVNSLLLKEWARKYLVLLMIPCVIFIFTNKFFYNKPYWDSLEKRIVEAYRQISLEKKDRIEQTRIKMEEIIKKYPPEEQIRLRQSYEQMNNNLPLIIFRASNLATSTMVLFWHLLIIYFFTLPDIKKEFK